MKKNSKSPRTLSYKQIFTKPVLLVFWTTLFLVFFFFLLIRKQKTFLKHTCNPHTLSILIVRVTTTQTTVVLSITRIIVFSISLLNNTSNNCNYIWINKLTNNTSLKIPLLVRTFHNSNHFFGLMGGGGGFWVWFWVLSVF